MNNIFSPSPSVQSGRLIYTPSSFARSSLLYLQEVGNLQALSPHTSSRANLASFLFFMVTSGEGQLVYGGVSYELKAGDLVFIDCTVPYSHSTSRSLWSLSWCHFNGPEMIGIYEKYKSRGGKPVFNSKNKEKYKTLLTTLITTACSSSYIRDMEINSILSSLPFSFYLWRIVGIQRISVINKVRLFLSGSTLILITPMTSLLNPFQISFSSIKPESVRLTISAH